MIKLPLNVWIIAATFSLTMTGISMLLFIGGLIGAQLAPANYLATLPIALFVVGNAAASIPAALLAQKFGRKQSAYIGFCASLLSTVFFIFALHIKSIYIFSCGGFLIGCGTAFYQQFRFAALESLQNSKDAGPALSVIMLSSIVGAFVGPEFASLGQHLIPNWAEYSGTFILYGLVIIICMLLFVFFKNPISNAKVDNTPPRPISALIRQPGFIIAMASAAFGFALMSFLMTSTPLSMHLVDGHSMHSAKGVIQAHLVAMYLPSVFSGLLIRTLGTERTMLAGGALYLGVIAIGISGQSVSHYWLALVCLGIGWNFLFLSGTAMLPQYYRHNERFRAQALNDFGVFSLQACASLSAAWVLFQFGWKTQLWLCLIPSAMLTIAASTLVYKNANRRPLKA